MKVELPEGLVEELAGWGATGQTGSLTIHFKEGRVQAWDHRHVQRARSAPQPYTVAANGRLQSVPGGGTVST